LICWCISSAPVRADSEARVTPGTVALLVEPKGLADINALQIAISDTDPAVRGVAARVAGILNRRDLATPLLDVLAREGDANAAGEQVRALLFLKGLEVLPHAKAAVMRLGEPVGSTLAEWLARTQPETFASTLADLLRGVREPDGEPFVAIAAMAIRQTPSARENISMAYAAAAPVHAWRELLDHLGQYADALVLKSGLTASRGAVREATVWFVVAAPSVTRTLASEALETGRTFAEGEPETEWALFGRELVARRSGQPPSTDGSEVIKRNGLTNLADAKNLAAVPELTAAERSALRGILPDVPVTAPAPIKQPRNLPEPVRMGPPTRTFPVIRPGLLGSLLAALGCTLQPNASAFGAARISYHPDGRPNAISIDTTTLKEPCAPFVRILAMLTVAPADQPVLDGEAQYMFLSMDKDVISCFDEAVPGPARDRGGERVSGGRIKVPRKTRNLSPEYPSSMQQARVSGIVMIEATITATGCIANARILRTIQLPLDLAALKAVSGWHFQPTQLDGKPVPVIMTVTVNFTLQ
jgi:TonB family protein